MQWLKIQLVYWPTLLWNVALGRWLKWRPWWSEVDKDVVLGALPFRSDVKRLHALGIRGVVNTCLEYPGPKEQYSQYQIEQFYMPTEDFTHPKLEDLRAAVAFIERQVEQNHRVYIHCKAGRARSATVLMCWLCYRHGMSAEAAQELMLQKRAHVNPHIKDRPVVQEFIAGLTRAS